jgi:aspartate carbamoyltransferase catalytic subunit
MNPDLLVVRHASAGAPKILADALPVPVINAGDGAHEHPTQALLDAFTIREKKKTLSGLKVAIIGDITHSRVARSNIFLLGKLGVELRIAGPYTMVPPGIEELGVSFVPDISQAIRDVDVIMMLRIQLERQQQALFPSIREYSRFFGLSLEKLKHARPDVLIMHPGPINRGVEISPEVADGPYSIILDQVTNGVAVRMALLYLLIGKQRD